MTINVNNLNKDVISALSSIKNKKEITPQEAENIKSAILKDSKVDSNELNLINKLTLSKNVIDIDLSKSPTDKPNIFKFNPTQGEAKNIINSIKQIGSGYNDINRGKPMSIIDKVALGADITGIADPTPVSDSISGAISLAKGDYTGAVLSGVSMIPYFGDTIGKPAKMMTKILKEFPDLSRILKSTDDIETIIKTLEKVGSSAKIPETLKAINNIQKDAELAYKNTKFLDTAKKYKLPTSGSITFVPPKKWDSTNPLKTSDKNGFIDAYGNEWRKGNSRTKGEHIEWDVIPKNKNSGIANLSRDGSHVNVSLEGRVSHI